MLQKDMDTEIKMHEKHLLTTIIYVKQNQIAYYFGNNVRIVRRKHLLDIEVLFDTSV